LGSTPGLSAAPTPAFQSCTSTADCPSGKRCKDGTCE
jgi:hypothetical protein